MVFTALSDQDPGPSKPIDWYVSVVFPPIIKKDLAAYFTALKALYDMLPLQNPEAGKWVLSIAMVALEIEDVDQLMDRLFPPLPEGMMKGATGPQPIDPQSLLTPLAAQGGFPTKLSPVPGMMPTAAQKAGVKQDTAPPIQESWAPPDERVRVHRLVEIARQAADAAEATYGRGD
jgi:hypothetical protein